MIFCVKWWLKKCWNWSYRRNNPKTTLSAILMDYLRLVDMFLFYFKILMKICRFACFDEWAVNVLVQKIVKLLRNTVIIYCWSDTRWFIQFIWIIRDQILLPATSNVITMPNILGSIQIMLWNFRFSAEFLYYCEIGFVLVVLNR